MIKSILSQLTLSILLFCGLIFFTGCGGGGEDDTVPPPEVTEDTRPFYMGFTPWLYEASINAMDVTYDRLNQHGDIIKHHFMEGIPWSEALAVTAYDPNVEADINNRLNRTPVSQHVFLAIDSLNSSRNGLANYWAGSDNLPLPPGWENKTWSDPEVISAYLSFSLDMIDRFQPDYFDYGTEISELILNDLAGYTDYLIFAQAIYGGIKAVHPNLKLMVSVAMKSPDNNEMSLINAGLVYIDDFVDVYGISTYPYVFFNHNDRGNPANLPVNWLSQATTFAGNKPLAISETGWIGEDLSIPQYNYVESSNQAKQQAYLEKLMTESEAMNMQFVIWWTVTDFDTLWNNELAQDPIAKIWKDIGFYDENQQTRSALTLWQNWLSRSYTR